MNYNSIISDIHHGKFAPVYFLDGDEAFFIDQILNELENRVLAEHERDFNQSILYGKDTDIVTVVSEARRFPMMAERVLVIVREAQHLLKSDLEKLESYVENPNPSTVLAFGYKGKKLDGRLKLTKLLKSKGIHFTSKALYESELPAWIESHAHGLGVRLDGMAVRILAEYLGSDLGSLHSELNKLRMILSEGQIANSDLVADQVGIHKDYNVFELTRALSQGDKKRIVQIAQYSAANPKEMNPVMVVSMLYSFFEKVIRLQSITSSEKRSPASVIGVHPGFLREYQQAAQRFPIRLSVRAMELLLEYDKRMKGIQVGTTPTSEWLKELLLQLIYLQKAR